MGINVSPHMARKSITKDTSGNIINMIDETNGGYIVRNRQIVNQAKWDELVKAEQDKRDAAKAALEAVAVNPELAALRNQVGVTPEQVAQAQAAQGVDRVGQLEGRMNSLDDKLDKILNALQK